MKYLLLFLLPLTSFAEAVYKVKSGQLHRKGKVTVSVLPETEHYKVRMSYDIKKKEFVAIPSKLLKGETVMEFPQAFRTEAGYRELEEKKVMTIPKAELIFTKRADVDGLKGAYFLKVKPTNKKSTIDIVYHPELPEVGWKEMEITFLSPIPVLNGYEIEAELK